MAAIETHEHVLIPLPDGTRLAARLWLPEGAVGEPVPAILEYIPYRKRDGTRTRDEPMHGYFAAAGYAVARVDMRGSGESDGLMDDEYLPTELNDACDVIAWLARQPWCSGAVGMMGKSWGGFNCLQVAALHPPALKAVLTVSSTDDRYTDDIHWMGGCLLNDNHWWGAIMLAYQSRPPTPELVGVGWRDIWRARLEHLPFFPALWAAHPRRDAYWKHGSINEDFDAIEVPVFALGGWADAYANAVPRLLEGLKVPRLGIIGPWAHLYPQDGAPAPAIGFLQEAVRWWDHWLKGRDTGIMAEPMLRAYLEAPQRPQTTRSEAPGRWVGEPAWPAAGILPKTFHLGSGHLLDAPSTDPAVSIRSPEYCGLACGEWMGVGLAGEAPADQRLDDGFSLVFDSAPLAGSFDVLGAPRLDLLLASDKPQAQIAVRLNEVFPDGAATRVSYQVLNLAHRDSHEFPTPLTPGAPTRVSVKLNDCGHTFGAGNRVRVSISTAYWPLIWPAPEAATLKFELRECALHLPVRPARASDAMVRFEPPAMAALTPRSVVTRSHLERTFALDLLTDTATYRTVGEGGVFGEGVIRFDEIDTTIGHSMSRTLTIKGNDPNSARSRITQSIDLSGPSWTVRIETDTEMTSTPTHYRMIGAVRTFDNGVPFVERTYDETIPRDV